MTNLQKEHEARLKLCQELSVLLLQQFPTDILSIMYEQCLKGTCNFTEFGGAVRFVSYFDAFYKEWSQNFHTRKLLKEANFPLVIPDPKTIQFPSYIEVMKKLKLSS